MEILTQLKIKDPDIEILVSRDLKKRHPQINSETKVEYFRNDHIEVYDFDAERFIEEQLKPHHEHLREDIKEEIRTNLNSIINDKNYLMKIADQYYQGKLKYYSTRRIPLEILYCEFMGKMQVLEYAYIPESDTICIREKL